MERDGMNSSQSLLPSSVGGEVHDGLSKAKNGQEKTKAAWRTTVRGGAAATAVVLLINIGTFVWTRISFQDNEGVATIFTGSCTVTKNVTLWVDLGINVLSTILLAASSSCAQLLSSPTRSDIDRVHRWGKWMGIGVPSMRNLHHIAVWRVLLWAILFISSTPLHLLYNSVIFTTLSAVDYQAALVTPEFLNGGWWNDTRVALSINGSTASSSYGMQFAETHPCGTMKCIELIDDTWPLMYVQQLHHMQNNLGTLQRLDNEECLKAYGTSMVESSWRSVLVVTNKTLPDNVIQVWLHSPGDAENDEGWICDGRNNPWFETCDVNSLLAKPSSWTIENAQQCDSSLTEVESKYDNQPCPSVPAMSAKVDYCLAEPFAGHCSVRINTYLLLVVVASNALKLACLLITAFSRNFDPLATIGDAVSSFLDHPEPKTEDVGPLSIMDVRPIMDVRACMAARRGKKSGLGDASSRPFKRQARRWAEAVSVTRWGFCLLLCISSWGLVLGFLVSGVSQSAFHAVSASTQSSSLSALWKEGLGAYTQQNTVATLSTAPIPNMLIANTPQAVISFVYLFYNNVFTCMVLAHEWNGFARTRKGLRVSNPVKGSSQRSTFWLQLPYRHVLPLMATMAILHWLTARSIFFVQMSAYDIGGFVTPKMQVDACVWSPMAVILSVIVGGILILALVGFSLRKLDPGMPIAGSCSLAISAAAHASRNEEDASLKPLMYGVTDEPVDKLGRERVGFSSRGVAPLVNGTVYI